MGVCSCTMRWSRKSMPQTAAAKFCSWLQSAKKCCRVVFSLKAIATSQRFSAGSRTVTEQLRTICGSSFRSIRSRLSTTFAADWELRWDLVGFRKLTCKRKYLVKRPGAAIWEDGVLLQVESDGGLVVAVGEENLQVTIDPASIAALPLSVHHEDTDSSENSDSDLSKLSGEESDEEEADEAEDVPVPSALLAEIGADFAKWESHTKGIGSRLLAKMGYVAGQGLGKHKQGRVEPVIPKALPAGMSLDFCAEKERGQARKRARLMNRTIKMHAEGKPAVSSVFEIANSILAVKASDAAGEGELKHKPNKASTAKSEPPSLNLQGLHLASEINRANRDIERLKEAMQRNAANTFQLNLMSQQLAQANENLAELMRRESRLNGQLRQASDKKKLRVF
eukprot:m.462320 g.462320  ORF g.462320 m.462320 type:complete len:395 (+) comp57022_c0_seq2:525-1709(+)